MRLFNVGGHRWRLRGKERPLLQRNQDVRRDEHGEHGDHDPVRTLGPLSSGQEVRKGQSERACIRRQHALEDQRQAGRHQLRAGCQREDETGQALHYTHMRQRVETIGTLGICI